MSRQDKYMQYRCLVSFYSISILLGNSILTPLKSFAIYPENELNYWASVPNNSAMTGLVCRFKPTRPVSDKTDPVLSTFHTLFCFLLSYLNNVVYVTSPHTIAELKTNIATAISNINTAMVRRVPQNLVKRIDWGCQFQHLL